jgi:selenium-binding protein 1
MVKAIRHLEKKQSEQIDCDTEHGGLTLTPHFFVDFGRESDGSVRAHEIRFPSGDATSDIWQ